jgi:hypothetical protein
LSLLIGADVEHGEATRPSDEVIVEYTKAASHVADVVVEDEV